MQNRAFFFDSLVFKNVLFNFHLFVSFPNTFLLLISCFIPLQLENIHYGVLSLLNLLGLVFWCILEDAWWLSDKESPCQCRRHKRHVFNPWVRKISWRRKWHSTPVSLAWEILGSEETGRLQSIGLESRTRLSLHAHTHVSGVLEKNVYSAVVMECCIDVCQV